MLYFLGLSLVVSLVSGILFGTFVRRQQRDWLYWLLLITVPFVSALVGFTLLTLWGIVELATLRSASRNIHPIYVQASGGAGLLTPAFFLIGIIPSIAGYLAARSKASFSIRANDWRR